MSLQVFVIGFYGVGFTDLRELIGAWKCTKFGENTGYYRACKIQKDFTYVSPLETRARGQISHFLTAGKMGVLGEIAE